MKNKKIIFATTTKNPKINYLENQINNYIKIGQKFSEFKIILIESNSENEININHFKKKYINEKNIVFKNLGNTNKNVRYPHLRTEQIAYARNQYLKLIFESEKLSLYDYLVIFDSDGVVNRMKYSDLLKIISLEYDWSAQFPNQLFFYYDIYALRAKDWINHDVLLPFNESIKNDNNPHFSYKYHISKYIKKIPRNLKPFNVISAFGGIGIYKISRIENSKYKGNLDGELLCEHVHFNSIINQNYPNTLFINPQWISHSGINEHTIKSKILTLLPNSVFNFFYRMFKN